MKSFIKKEGFVAFGCNSLVMSKLSSNYRGGYFRFLIPVDFVQESQPASIFRGGRYLL